MTILWAILLTLLFTPPRDAEHKFHVSYNRVAVEDNIVVARLRFFKDDLGVALAELSGSESLLIDATPITDSLFQAYIASHFILESGEQRLTGGITASGEEVLGKEMMWWYLVEYQAPETISSLRLTNTLLLDSFDDQKNILQLQHFPSEDRWSYYFLEDDREFYVEFGS